MSQELQTVKLKNGSTHLAGVVQAAMVALESLPVALTRAGAPQMLGLLAVYELYELCTNPDHRLWDERLLDAYKALHLVDADGIVHGVTRDVVLSGGVMGGPNAFEMSSPIDTEAARA